MQRRQIAVLEMQTQAVPPFVLDAIEQALSPSNFEQLDLWAFLRQLDEGEG
jgi:hypothetical protein